MPRTLVRLSKAVSLVGAGLFAFYGARLLVGEPTATDFLKATLFALTAITLGLNLVRIPRVGAVVFLIVHTAVAIYFAHALWNMTAFVFGETGSRSGVWSFFVPPFIMLIAVIVSTILNLYRLKSNIGRK